jgi:uncharacterized protein (TIGR00645 family)
MATKKTNFIENALERFIFASRWVQAPLYAGLIIASLLYAYKFLVELVHMVLTVNTMTEELIMLGILSLVDITMVSNLVIMVVIGGYATFVSKLNIDEHHDKPEWLEKVDAGALKIKMAGSLASVSGIHLLKTFINIEQKEWDHVVLQIAIHLVFVISTLIMAYTEVVIYKKYAKKKA